MKSITFSENVIFLVGEQKFPTETILENSEQNFETENNFVNAIFSVYVNKND